MSDDLTTEVRQAWRKFMDVHKAAWAENIESKVLRQGLLDEGEIVPLNELEISDWLEKLRHKNNNSTLAKTYENSPVRSQPCLEKTVLKHHNINSDGAKPV